MARGPVTGALASATPSLSKSQQAYRWLKEQIVSHEFAPGYRLVLASIGAELGMSVVPVREAIRQLEAEGLVTFERNVGAHVSMIDDSQYRHSMETLAILEGATTALAAGLLTADDLRRARETNTRIVESLDSFDPRTLTTLNQQFHSILFAPCPNPHLLELVTTEWARLGNLRDSTFSFVPHRARESAREHENILRLIETGAPPAQIEKASRQHRLATLNAYLTHKHADDDAGPTRTPTGGTP